jgi:hypothetical protein
VDGLRALVRDDAFEVQHVADGRALWHGISTSAGRT